MILPIYGYGHPVLRKKTGQVAENEKTIAGIIESMYDTMYNANGVGLAAPQIGKSLRIFIVDGTPMDGMDKENPEIIMKGWKKVFINPIILEETGKEWAYEEGCLSIPDIRADVFRKSDILVQYQDENFKTHTESFSGLKARIIQHEHDHLEGVLFTDKISPLKRELIRSRLNRVSRGLLELRYPMRFLKAVT